ncbi:Uncharacterised protein [Yersinia enterocolitica]|nr:Uncharacterised protein [Yersinia enterocolitica]
MSSMFRRKVEPRGIKQAEGSCGGRIHVATLQWYVTN